MSEEIGFNWREIEPGKMVAVDEHKKLRLEATDSTWRAELGSYAMHGEARSIHGAAAWAESAVPRLRLMALFPNKLDEARLIVLSELPSIPLEAIDRPTTEGQDPGTLLFRVRAPATVEMVREAIGRANLPLGVRFEVELA
jgi:hypothetical protein